MPSADMDLTCSGSFVPSISACKAGIRPVSYTHLAAVKAGMPKKQALELTAQTVLGSAKMVLESGEHPWALIDQVCSPGGTTIEGICSLEANNFEATLCKAFDAVFEKDKRL